MNDCLGFLLQCLCCPNVIYLIILFIIIFPEVCGYCGTSNFLAEKCKKCGESLYPFETTPGNLGCWGWCGAIILIVSSIAYGTLSLFVDFNKTTQAVFQWLFLMVGVASLMLFTVRRIKRRRKK
jgi:hypothetical protein